MENTKENMHIDIGASRVKLQLLSATLAFE